MSRSRLVLASQSAARLKMLIDAGVDVEPIAPPFEEDAEKAGLRALGAPPIDVARALAAGKAVAASKVRPGDLVLGADQTLEIDGETFDKSLGAADLRAQLLRLRGRRHSLHSAAVLARDGAPIWMATATAHLSIRPFSDAFLDAYVSRETHRVLGCVGGYRLEGLGAQLFDRIEGDIFTVLGLPLLDVLAALRSFGALQA